MSIQNKKSNFHLQSFRFKELYGSVSENVNVSITTLTPCLESAVVVFGKIVETRWTFFRVKLVFECEFEIS